MMKTGKMVTLIDGREVDSASEARHVAGMAPEARSDYLAHVAQKRSTEAFRALEALALRMGPGRH